MKCLSQILTYNFRGWHRIGGILGLLVIIVAGSAAPRQASAELTWAQKSVDVDGDARTPVLEAHFHFTNTGTRAVEIRNVESSCGCTTTALEKRTYKPQESGEIIARYTFGTHTGLQQKTLLVQTDDGNAPTTLTLVAHILEILRVTPSVVTWSHNETPKPKRISLEMVQDTPFEDISVESSSTAVSTKLVPLVRGRQYVLVVFPEHTDGFLYAKLTIHCRFATGEKMFTAYATVQPGSAR